MQSLATDRQLSFLNSLFNEREASTPGAEKMRSDAKEGKVSKVAASKWIEYLLTQPRKAGIDPPLGMHEFDGQVFKVYKTRTSKQVVAKVLFLGGAKPEFQYCGKSGLKGLSEKTAMTAGAASKFGKLYGMCVNCAATLTDERSIFVGYGPTCAANNGWPWGEKDGLEGLAAAPTPTESTPVEESPVGGPEPVYEDPEVKDAEELASSDLFSLL